MTLLKSNTYNSLLQSFWTDYNDLLDALKEKTVMITGASGMIGSFIVDALMCANIKNSLNCRVIVMGRNADSLSRRFSEYINNTNFVILAHDVTKELAVSEQVDFIIHAASNADPASFSKYPVDTLLANVIGTYNLLEFSRRFGVQRFMFISSGEFYGSSENIENGFTENDLGKLDFSSSRICYPEGKRSAEALCKCYEAQYGIDTVTVRPCHIFGPTMTDTDSRAVSQFFRNALGSEDILLNSPGNIQRSHCYVSDAAAGILVALIRGQKGEAYNISDEKLKMTIRQFAQQVANAGGTKLIFNNPSDSEVVDVIPNKRQVLDNSKLTALGWSLRDTDKIQETLTILKEAQ
ncbi:MAG: NAD-dependent epimerase/dehydratase family protein [Eubacterium sp.]|nr:NAD-dependent epimerase/dehydratase family protein [Eubacterium sp.]